MPMPLSEYICFNCRKKFYDELPLVKAKTTLVMIPLHIAMQWITELHKHLVKDPNDINIKTKAYCEGRIHNLRYLLYPGISVILSKRGQEKCKHSIYFTVICR